MKKQNMNLASEVLRYEQRHTQFWHIAFLVVLLVEIIKSIVGKAVKRNEQK